MYGQVEGPAVCRACFPFPIMPPLPLSLVTWLMELVSQ